MKSLFLIETFLFRRFIRFLLNYSLPINVTHGAGQGLQRRLWEPF